MRQTSNNFDFLNELALNATAATTTQLVDGWLLRASSDLPFRRCNCATPTADTGDIPIDEIERFYAERGQRAVVQLDPSEHEAFDTQLSHRDYETEAPTDIFVAKPAVVRGQSRPAANVRTEELDVKQESFAQLYGMLHHNDRVRAYGHMLATIGPSAHAIVAYIDDEIAGMAFGVYERGWCGIFGMITLAPFRRRGVATTILHALARDADDLYLQVERDNAAARALYVRVGFTYAYGYHYRVKR